MKLDTAKKGLEAIFMEWHVPLIDELFKGKSGSGKLHKFAEEHDIRTGGKGSSKSVSRAGVIFFLNDLVEENILTYDFKTGKGGHHRVYKMLFTREEFALKLIDLFLSKLLEVFPEASTTFSWTRP